MFPEKSLNLGFAQISYQVQYLRHGHFCECLAVMLIAYWRYHQRVWPLAQHGVAWLSSERESLYLMEPTWKDSISYSAQKKQQKKNFLNT